jgi:hypothetical protein
MTDQEKINFKKKLKQVCYELIQHRIEATKKAIANAQQSANNEQKSSAGDKYETSRALSHLEKDMHARQLAENLKELGVLHSVNVEVLYESVTAGAFLECTGVSFFLIGGFGKKLIDNKEIFLLSPHAPLAQKLTNKKPGYSFVINKVETTIVDIY